MEQPGILRKAEERGYADHGWLKTHYSFSFANYFDSAHMGWGNLRVINDDIIAPGGGFGKHPHRDMEILTYVLSGKIAHEDSMGNIKTIPAGSVQRMSAGKGIFHSEFNPSKEESTHLLQIWILPTKKGIEPSYEQKDISTELKSGRLCLIASPEGTKEGLSLHTQAKVYAGLFHGGQKAQLSFPSSSKAYVHLVAGELRVNGQPLHSGDALKLEKLDQITLTEGKLAEVLVFELSAESI